MTPKEAYELALSKKLEEFIATDLHYSYLYARYVLKAPFPAGEKLISISSWYAYKYARRILKGPFPEGEASIRKHLSFSLDYQFRFNRDICLIGQIYEYPAYALAHALMIGGRFPEGEPAMRKSPRIWKRYQEFLKEKKS